MPAVWGREGPRGTGGCAVEFKTRLQRRGGQERSQPSAGHDALGNLEEVLSQKPAGGGGVGSRMDDSRAGGEKEAGAGAGWIMRASRAVDRGLSHSFGRLGSLVGRHPLRVIGLCVLLATCTSLPLVGKALPGKGLFKFHEEHDKEKLYAASDSKAAMDGMYVANLYETEPLTQLVLVAKNRSQPSLNILTKEHIAEAWDLWAWIQMTEVVVDGQSYRWDDVCARPKMPNGNAILGCKMFSIFDVWDMNRTAFEADTDVLSTITEKSLAPGATVVQSLARGAANAQGALLFRDLIIGQKFVEYDQNGTLKSAEAFRITMVKKNEEREINGEAVDPVATAWEDAITDLVVFKWQGRLLRGYTVSLEEVDKQSGEQIRMDTSWVVLSYVLVIAVSHFVLFRNSRSMCKAHLTMISVVAITMAIGTSIGLVNFMGVPYSAVVATVPFLLVGLGVDDTFVIMGAYAAAPVYHSAEERVKETMMRAGTSIFVTSLTDFVAFAFGTLTRIPAVRSFCMYAAVGILVDFFYQVTFFVAFVALDIKREDRARKGATLLGFGPNFNAAQIAPPKIQSMGSVESQIARRADYEMEHCAMERERSTEYCLPKSEMLHQKEEMHPKCCGSGDFDPQKPSISRKFIGQWLPAVILHPMGTAAVVAIEALTLCAAVYGCTNVYMDFQVTELYITKGSWLEEAFALEDRYFGGSKIAFHVYTKEPSDDWNYYYHEDELKALGEAMRGSPAITNRPFPFTFWYESFIYWSRIFHAADLVDGRAPNATAFIDWLHEFLSTSGQGHLGDVVFSPDGSRITSTRTLAFMNATGPMSEQIAAADAIQASAVAAAPTLQAFPYGTLFPFFDGFRIVTEETLKNVMLSALAVALICLVTLADVVTTASVVAMVVLTDVWVLGSMWYADLHFNIVTSINLVLAVGIAIDYSVHVAHSFLVVEGTRRERAQMALYHIGGEVFSGALTTYLAVGTLVFAKHYIFRAFFKMLTVIILGGVWHGLVLLPVVLSLVGPPSYGSRS